MPASLDTIIQAIAARIANISGAGKVLAYQRYTPAESEQIDEFVADGILNFCTVDREATASHRPGAGLSVRSQHKIVMEFFRAVTLGPESKKIFQTLLEAVRADLDQDPYLLDGNNMRQGWLSTTVQVSPMDNRMVFGKVLSWHARLDAVAEPTVMGG